MLQITDGLETLRNEFKKKTGCTDMTIIIIIKVPNSSNELSQDWFLSNKLLFNWNENQRIIFSIKKWNFSFFIS